MDIYDLTGPAFLQMFGILMFIAFGAALTFRMLCQIAPKKDVNLDDLNVYDAAYLAGGQSTAVTAAVTSLMHRGALKILPSTDSVEVSPIGEDLHPFEKCLLDNLAGKSSREATRVCKYQVQAADFLHPNLENLGLVASRSKSALARIVSTLLLLTPVLLLGLPKISIGIDRHKPVGFLVIMCLIFALIAWLFYVNQVVRTFHGDQTLLELQMRYGALRTSASAGAELTGAEVVLALALFGAGAIMALPSFAASCQLAGTPRVMLSSGSGGSCGGGGCGGGCGGGGCGGCGG